MTDEELPPSPLPQPPPPFRPLQHRAPQPLPDHPLRLALLDLLAETGTLTSTQAAAHLGHSSGLCSFHLRQLARHGLIEEAPNTDGRARPWQLRWNTAQADAPSPALHHDLEDESFRHWLAHRDRAPAAWQRDESFSAVLHLTPAEMAELGTSLRALLAPYRDRESDPGAPLPADATAVAAVTRLFPLLAR
ncbi:helix-turn-helix domain-containing protein [Streptomyces sp. NPDC051561]|uniref:helix-turn-helix domain-containing protein n=1 Tax=Streptomyces sp. NPDC051561 TaxID=3365658 RepID=UPI00378AE1AF